MVFVSVTRLRVRSVRYLPFFFIHALLSSIQASRSTGSLDVRLLRDQKSTFWTITLWQSESAMRLFMTSGSHRQVMPKLLHWCDEASVVHWNQISVFVPVWMEAHQRMQQEGRRSKVDHPSEDHLAYAIPPPVVGKTRQLRFK
ncbi:hypothetical protein QN360_17795 [Glaciimonas sp. CA11.2]|uniref:hypothetical protein n=1 Tax=unclassified Glaciimonas TaxID=2644401 RepID=UPI002AB5115E|nr:MULTISPECIES: hypothetical protein [unclassified Glaciimonas]MDY7545478.1 hypothetical protein [Glaciimonas sp. CA11.2]MEB0012808.1 hypothetical protein [Glaciimonas sp. Cout2]MEB0082286.1 hypothetical protein [Glaciimonas sp. Gout2]MEB0164751.1 hypothetical protein [Glaciimonas sp. CA11.2]